MKCPVCKIAVLAESELEQNLQSLQCPDCGGRWIKAFQYWQWLNAHQADPPETPPQAEADLPVSDSPPGKLCPECGHFLRRQQVGHGINFALDRCGTCGGIWLDRNEWEVLRSHRLHDHIHFIFSLPWQAEVQAEQLRNDYRRNIRGKLGDADFTLAEEIKRWLDGHPNRPIVLAFLNEPEERPMATTPPASTKTM